MPILTIDQLFPGGSGVNSRSRFRLRSLPLAGRGEVKERWWETVGRSERYG